MDASVLRNFKDFLQLYNKMTENCFSRCVDNTNSRKLDDNEIICVDDCAQKFINFNNKLMTNFVKAQTQIVNKRVEEAQQQLEINQSNNSINNGNVQQEIAVSN